MRREFISWVKPLGQYVCRLGKRFFARQRTMRFAGSFTTTGG